MKTLRSLIAEKTQDVEALIGMIDAGRFSTFHELKMHLKKTGNPLRQIGQGYWSRAFVGEGNRPDWVLKVTGRDDGYEEFVKLCMANQGKNPFFPKIRKEFTIDGSQFRFVEHLTTGYDTDIDERVIKVLREVGGLHNEHLWADENYSWTTIIFKDVLPDFVYGRVDERLLFEALAKEFSFKLADLMEFYTTASEAGAWDAKLENIGLRRNGEMVIYDPVF